MFQHTIVGPPLRAAVQCMRRNDPSDTQIIGTGMSRLVKRGRHMAMTRLSLYMPCPWTLSASWATAAMRIAMRWSVLRGGCSLSSRTT
jgi:hypothetical protein